MHHDGPGLEYQPPFELETRLEDSKREEPLSIHYVARRFVEVLREVADEAQITTPFTARFDTSDNQENPPHSGIIH